MVLTNLQNERENSDCFGGCEPSSSYRTVVLTMVHKEEYTSAKSFALLCNIFAWS